MFEFFEFFAGGGMVRAGLGDQNWRCRFANDFDHKKSAIYRANWGDGELKTADIKTLSPKDLHGEIDLAWASFPCQDLSLAGGGAGLKGDRSGAFWPFWDLMKQLIAEDRAPKIIALENVCGALSSHQGNDFAAICSAFEEAGYTFGALVIDAALFVPQSRPRLFIIGVRAGKTILATLIQDRPSPLWHSRGLTNAHKNMPPSGRRNWVWWSLPEPPARNRSFSDLIEDDPADVEWRAPAKTRALLDMMSDVNRAKVDAAKRSKRRQVGTIYRRTRVDADGCKAQRAEVRFDDVAGCLRTPAGGSSRQLILVVEGQKVRSRLISGRETARLMGLPDEYQLPTNYNEAYHLTGDGVVVHVVRHLAKHLFEPVLEHRLTAAKVAA